MRGVLHYMQRTAVQGSPTMLMRVMNEWMPGAERPTDRVHPFRKYFDEPALATPSSRIGGTVTEADIVNFAGISGDYFYAHMDDLAAKESLFERRVARWLLRAVGRGWIVHRPRTGPGAGELRSRVAALRETGVHRRQ